MNSTICYFLCSSAIEFKSTMRMNLHTQKAGKEIEVAWLKAVVAFMNTDGGTLLFGVSDDGVIKGLDADGFASDDKCQLHFKNVINQHIGAESHKHLSFKLVNMDGKQIGVVSCSRCAEPVYLRTGKSEEFYIRSGPSNDALPVSKIVTYIQNRS
jgi:predicted HTH transcriptional regulator